MKNYLIVHYDEIGTKGKNRKMFENQLITNIKKALNTLIDKIYRRYGVIVIIFTQNKKDIINKLKLIPGIANFSFPLCTNLNIEDIKVKSLEIMKNKENKTFKIKTKRSYKKFPLISPEINKIVGNFIEKNTKNTAEMVNPEILLKIEIGEKEAFIYSHKYYGIGGLPIGSGEKTICSLSGGLDSPVSAFEIMKRGSKVIFVHIYNNTLNKGKIINKIKKLVEILNNVQINSKLYVIPFSNIQKEIILNIPSEYRMIIYRRYMFKLINHIAIKENAKAIITGDSLGQVASQTIANLSCIWNASKLPIISPLISQNKKDIISIAKKIGTYDVSIEPYPDCCSFMIAKHPETKADINTIISLEKNIIDKEDRLITESLENSTIFKI
jgi:thiamine biosynthesis protein ThiI